MTNIFCSVLYFFKKIIFSLVQLLKTIYFRLYQKKKYIIKKFYLRSFAMKWIYFIHCSSGKWLRNRLFCLTNDKMCAVVAFSPSALYKTLWVYHKIKFIYLFLFDSTFWHISSKMGHSIKSWCFFETKQKYSRFIQRHSFLET